jgi:hypothetical protein
LLISTREDSTIRFYVEAPGLGIEIEGTTREGVHAKVDIPKTAIVGKSDTNKGIHVYTKGDSKISVVAVMESPQYIARFSVLQQKQLLHHMYVYYVATADDFLKHKTFAVIVALEDNTTITIHAPVKLQVGNQILNSNEKMEVSMERYGTVIIHSRRDITGTKITSFEKPIVLFSGHSCTNIPSEYGSCDTIIEQLPSTNDWGMDFIVSPLKHGMLSQLQIISSESNNSVNVYCISGEGQKATHEHYSLAEGFPIIRFIKIDEVCHVTSIKRIMVLQYVISQEADNSVHEGGPAMMVIPSTSQYSPVTLVPAVDSSLEHHITIVVPSEYYHTELIHINRTLTLSELEQTIMIFYNNYTITHYICQIQVPAGDYHIYSSQKEARMGVIAYSHSGNSSFGYLASIKSSGTLYNAPLVKTIGDTNYGLCINTTSRGPIYWRDDTGIVVSTNTIINVSSSYNNVSYWCEVPTHGNEPQHYYRERYLPSGIMLNNDFSQDKVSCSFSVQVFPQRVLASIFTNITLYCLTTEEKVESFIWLYNRTEEVGKGPFLTLVDATTDRSGLYTCYVTSQSGSSASNSSTVLIENYFPVITGHPQSVHLALDGTRTQLNLTCRADVMAGTIIWEKEDGATLSRGSVVEQNGNLIITDPKLEDSGHYRCAAVNDSGYSYSSYAEVTLDVQVPTIQIHPKNQTIFINTTVQLDCFATGYEPIGYQWMHSSSVMDITDRHLKVEDINGASEGEYICVTTNAGGINISNQAFVRVLKPGVDNIADKEISAYTSPHELIAYVGTKAVFNCYGVHGSGNYSYLWLNRFQGVVGNGSTLTISWVTADLSGNYSCLVIDDKGAEANSSAELIVASKHYINNNNICIIYSIT